MKKFLRKSWRGVPVGIISAVLAVCLLAGSVLAAYNFLTFTTVITVDEPLKIEMRWWDYNEAVWTDWWELAGVGGADELDLYMSPGEVQTFGLRIYNISYSPLTVHTEITGMVYYFTFDGFPDGVVPGSDGDNASYEWIGQATITADGATPAGDYHVTFGFTRE